MLCDYLFSEQYFCLDMVRTYKRKTQRGAYGDDILKAALLALEEQPLKTVSRLYHVPARTLRRHRDNRVATWGALALGPMKTVLPAAADSILRDHIAYMEKYMYGLTTIDVRRLAYDLAEKLGVQHKFSVETKLAGRDWLRGFFKRHEDLAIRHPQGTNIARAVGFNRPKVRQFFDLYKSQLEMSTYTSARIWNMDETGITNVQKPGKIDATKGVRQVGRMASG